MSVRRRRLLTAVLGFAVAVGVGACDKPSGETDPPGPSPSPDASVLRDDLTDGIAIEERGFSTFPVPGGGETRRIIGAATVVRNTTAQPMSIHVEFRLVDDAGRGWRSGLRDDWASVFNAGWAYLPPGQSVELGGSEQFSAEDAARVAGIVLYVHGEPTEQSALLPATISQLRPRPQLNPEWDYVSFDVDNTWGRFRAPNYVMVFRSPDGRLRGGWFVDRAHFVDLAKSLPAGETDEYRRGTSRHTLPTLLPPDIEPGDVTMYVWPR